MKKQKINDFHFKMQSSKRKEFEIIKYFFSLALATITTTEVLNAQSTLLENVKNDPNEAISLCQSFKDLNKKGIKASSKQSLEKISDKKNINIVEAEILAIYVRGLYCPEVR